MERFRQEKLLGKGSYGAAYLCVRTSGAQLGARVVIKEVNIQALPEAQKKAALQEA